MAVTIRAVTAERIEHVRSTSAKLSVAGKNTGVDHVGANAGAGPVVGVGGAQGPVALIDAVKAPRGIALCYISRHNAIFLDVLHSEVLAQSFCIFRRHLNRKAVDRILVDVFEIAAMRGGEFRSDVASDGERTSLSNRVLVENDDVTVFDLVWVAAKLVTSALATGWGRNEKSGAEACENH